MLRLNAGRRPWASPASLALRPRRPTSTVITTSRMSPHLARQYRPSFAPLGSFRQPAISLPFREMRPLPQWLASPQLKAPVVLGGYTGPRSHPVNRLAGRHVETTAPTSPRFYRTVVTQPIAFEAIIQVLASRFPALGHTFGNSRPSSEHSYPARPRRAAAVAPFGYNHAGDKPFGAKTHLTNAPTRAVPTASASQTSTVSGPKITQSIPSESPGRDGNRSKPGRGELYIEGSVLGRWLTQHLNREIVRPRAGIMAVDPRITPSWGGPPLAT